MSKPSPQTQRPYYHQDVDFQALALQDTDFSALLQSNEGRIDWQDPQAVQQLTRSLLKRDFNLALTLPPDRLCPPVPVRWNYIRWIQDLLATTQPSHTDTFNPSHQATGLDIGTGASSIYCLLACSSAPGWRMFGTDIDTHSLRHAQSNVEANDLNSRIKLHLTSPEDPLIPLDKLGVSELDFVVCNPPFYSSEEDMHRAYGDKAMPASAVCTGSNNEMICEGGDVGFVERILNESLELRDRVRWYSAMFGRLTSVQIMVKKLREHNITNFAVTNLTAGQKTKRLAVAWSFSDFRPSNAAARSGELVMAILPPATEWTISLRDDKASKASELGERINTILSAYDLRWSWRPNLSTGVAYMPGDVWSRHARRKRKAEMMGKAAKRAEKFQKTEEAEEGKSRSKDGGNEAEDGSEEDSDEDEEPVGLAVKIVCKDNAVEVRWLRGTDFSLFESFVGMLKRSLGLKDRRGPEKAQE